MAAGLQLEAPTGSPQVGETSEIQEIPRSSWGGSTHGDGEIEQPTSAGSAPHRTEAAGDDDTRHSYLRDVDARVAANDFHYPKLEFRFFPITTLPLLVALAVWLALLGGCLYLTIVSRLHPDRLQGFTGFTAWGLRYTPGILGSVTVVWWRVIVQAWNRMVPYYDMANIREALKGKKTRTEVEAVMIQRLVLLDTAFISVGAMFRAASYRHFTTLNINVLGFFLGLFLTPIKSSFFQVVEQENGFTLAVSSVIGGIIAGFYFFLALWTGRMIYQFWKKPTTGLRWNPAYLASQIAMLQESDLISDDLRCVGLEFDDYNRFTSRVETWPDKYGVLRLGYWENPNPKDPNKLIYACRFISIDQVLESPAQPENDRWGAFSGVFRAFREALQYLLRIKKAVNAPLHRFRSWALGRERSRTPQRDPHPLTPVAEGSSPSDAPYLKHVAPQVYATDIEFEKEGWNKKPLWEHRYRNRWKLHPSVPQAFPTNGWILFTLLVSLGALAAFSYFIATNQIYGTISLAPAYTTVNGLPRALLFSFLPSLFFVFINITFLTSDNYHRMMRPIMGMDKPGFAHENLLIDYVTTDPITTVVKAGMRRDYRICFLSLIALFSPIGPILAGSMFSFDEKAGTATADPTLVHLVLAQLCIACVLLPFAMLDPRYSAGRVLGNIIDTAALCYDSPLFDRELDEFDVQWKDGNPDEVASTREGTGLPAEMHEELFKSRVLAPLRKYGFGYYEGRTTEKRRRLGFSIAADSRDARYKVVRNSEEVRYSVHRIRTTFRFLRFIERWYKKPQLLSRRDTESTPGFHQFAKRVFSFRSKPVVESTRHHQIPMKALPSAQTSSSRQLPGDSVEPIIQRKSTNVVAHGAGRVGETKWCD